MSWLLDRIGAFFLEPPVDRDAAPPAEPGGAPPARVPTAATGEPPPPAGGRSSPLGFAQPSAARSAAGSPTPRSAARPEPPGSTGPSGDRAAFGGFAPPSAGRSDATGLASTAETAVVPTAAVRSDPAAGAPARARDAGAHLAAPALAHTGFAAVLGARPEAVPVAAACAGELRAQARATAAVLCVWGGGEPPAGATTPAVRRLAARLAAHGLAATAAGRLAWVALDPSPAHATPQLLRVRALADAPTVLAIAGPRPAAFEPLLADADFALVVLPAEAEEPLRALALATLPSRASLAVPPLLPGPPRWAAMAGLARMRSLEPVPR